MLVQLKIVINKTIIDNNDLSLQQQWRLGVTDCIMDCTLTILRR